MTHSISPSRYASFIDTYLPLWTQQGLRAAQSAFGPEVLSALPVFTTGSLRGKPRATFRYTRVERGGWDVTQSRVETRTGKVIAQALHHATWPNGIGDAIVLRRIGG